MGKEPYNAPARFFEDSEFTTRVHWYPVPSDRPVLPYPSFVGRPEWEDENGPGQNMYMGCPPQFQGTQFVPSMGGAARVPRLEQLFTGEFCGTKRQWAGDLRTDRPEDIGDPLCCKQRHLAAHSESKMTASIGEFSFSCRRSCSCTDMLFGYRANVSANASACSCTRVQAEYILSPHHNESACSCSAVEYFSSSTAFASMRACSCSVCEYETYSTVYSASKGCSCSQMPFMAANRFEDPKACSCSLMTVRIDEGLRACSCSLGFVVPETVSTSCCPAGVPRIIHASTWNALFGVSSSGIGDLHWREDTGDWRGTVLPDGDCAGLTLYMRFRCDDAGAGVWRFGISCDGVNFTDHFGGVTCTPLDEVHINNPPVEECGVDCNLWITHIFE